MHRGSPASVHHDRFGLDLDQEPWGDEAADLDHRSRGSDVSEVLRVGAAHRFPLIDVRDVDPGADHVGHLGPRTLEDLLNAFEDHEGLGVGVVLPEDLSIGSARHGARNMDMGANADRPGVADGRFPGGAGREVLALHVRIPGGSGAPMRRGGLRVGREDSREGCLGVRSREGGWVHSSALLRGNEALDLERLKIDREPARHAPQRSGGGPWFGRLVFLGVVAGALWFFRAPIGEWADRFRLPTVELVRAQEANALERSAVSGTAANGYIVAARRAALSADTPGRIVEMLVTEGSVVEEGELVARLFDEEYAAALRSIEAQIEEANATRNVAERQVEARGRDRRAREAALPRESALLAEAKASGELASKDLLRQQRLFDEGIATQERLDQAVTEDERARARIEAQNAALTLAERAIDQAKGEESVARERVAEAGSRLATLQALRDQAKATLDKTEVRAPFDGVVVLKDAEVGEVVSPNSQGGSSARGSVATLIDFDSLEVQVDVPETTLPIVRIGAPANVYLDAFPTRPYEGTVDRIWPTADRQKATVEVRVVFRERDENLRPEMGCRVVFDPKAADGSEPLDEAAATAPGVQIPEECLLRLDGSEGVFIVEQGVAKFRPLQIGARRNGRAVVESGLEVGEQVVSNPPATLTDGDRVLVKGNA